MKRYSPIILIFLSFILAACGPAAAPEVAVAPPEPAATNTTSPPTETPLPELDPTETLVEAVVEVSEAEPTLAPTDTPAPAPTATTEPPTPVPEPVDWLASVGRTSDNLMFLGNPEAPITMTDYSDFM